ncbi:alpha/beta hydrolase fold domain-containing protein [Cardiosporidium cionae]|uniref:Alpha/beta hydrolase fold domain-containing protein n=1 Tax=Cardiosporidium cionae TaxID=476202 RepID=A0ABQ7JA86_9APIC|nr:alpha/beta hydrolase fold domain-containing protein [Cardiosporidium cionae]|eukprot:KAF8820879.1 alpha/beta hydrolase fold domain-containing protein [Cardiosporidium cionae]
MMTRPSFISRVFRSTVLSSLRSYASRTRWPHSLAQLKRDRGLLSAAASSYFHLDIFRSFKRRVISLSHCKGIEFTLPIREDTLTERAVPEKYPLSHQRIDKEATRIDSEPQRWILFLHGGAFCLNSPDVYQMPLHELAKGANCSIFSPAYRLSPEVVFPYSLRDSLDAYSYLLKTLGADPKNVIFAGDSAGGNLAITLTMKLLQENLLPPPAGIVGFSPWLDLSLKGPSYYSNAANDLLIPFESVRRAAWLYLNGNFNFDVLNNEEANVRLKEFCLQKGMPYVYKTTNQNSLFEKMSRNPFVSPIYFQAGEWIRRFPPVLFHCAAEELLMSDSLIFGRRLNDEAKRFNREETEREKQKIENDTKRIYTASVDDVIQKYGVLDAMDLKKAEEDAVFATGCNPFEGNVRVGVKVWRHEFHAFPMFGYLNSPNASRCLEESVKWINGILQ